MDEKSEEEKIQALAEMMPSFLGLAAFFIPYLDLLERTEEAAAETSSRTRSMAPIIGAVGGDWEASQFEADLRTKRSKALAELVRVLKETAEEQAEFEKKQAAKGAGLEQLRRAGLNL